MKPKVMKLDGLSRSAALLCLGLLCLGLPASAPAQGLPGAKVATATATAVAVARGGRGVLAVTATVAPGFHVNAHEPNDPDLIPTTISLKAVAGVTFGAAKYPATKSITVSYEKKPMLVYQTQFVILVPFTVAATAKPGLVVLHGTLGYQGCNARSCYPPASCPVQAAVTVK